MEAPDGKKLWGLQAQVRTFHCSFSSLCGLMDYDMEPPLTSPRLWTMPTGIIAPSGSSTPQAYTATFYNPCNAETSESIPLLCTLEC
ncbi:hypothetical protein TNIN_61541 [Trichonephila inaurata madagascariensis]|uniref:Uncharacterized protein n=1 Tax=Trichonephila inaurata madagascariensis TaxID=2747483 RepID=A0A8X6Y240_9ARAC|nr:hypothetical protein TNIN_61541 [Trichonephila inaurata madagascariensis]